MYTRMRAAITLVMRLSENRKDPEMSIMLGPCADLFAYESSTDFVN